MGSKPTIFLKACTLKDPKEDIQVIQKYVTEQNVNYIYPHSKYPFQNPLQLVCLKGVSNSVRSLQVVQYLIQKGANVNLFDNFYRTPLMLLCFSEPHRIYLFDSNNNNNKENDNNKDALLLKIDNDDVTLSRHHLEIAQLLIQHGADVNVSRPCFHIGINYEYGGETALHFCAFQETSLEKNREEREKRKILQKRKRKSLYELAKLLIVNGADKTKRNRFGQTPFEYAQANIPLEEQDENMMQLLLN